MHTTPPSIVAFLAEQGETLQFHFIKPKPGIDLNVLHQSDPMTHLRIVQLSVMGRTCIPFHKHKSKEKVYTVVPSQHPGGTILPMKLGIINPDTGDVLVHTMSKAGETFVVPQNHWHTIWMPDAGPAHTQLIVVSSSQDGADIVWTPKGDLLVELCARLGHDCQDENPLLLPPDELEKHLDAILAGTT
jgi:hypothetical protein